MFFGVGERGFVFGGNIPYDHNKPKCKKQPKIINIFEILDIRIN